MIAWRRSDRRFLRAAGAPWPVPAFNAPGQCPSCGRVAGVHDVDCDDPTPPHGMVRPA